MSLFKLIDLNLYFINPSYKVVLEIPILLAGGLCGIVPKHKFLSEADNPCPSCGLFAKTLNLYWVRIGNLGNIHNF